MLLGWISAINTETRMIEAEIKAKEQLRLIDRFGSEDTDDKEVLE